MKQMLQNFRRLSRQAPLLRNRDFLLASAGRSVAAVGYGAVVVTIMLHLQEAVAGRAGVWAVAAFLLASTVPTVVAAPWAGRLADTRDSRLLAVSTSLVSAGAVAAMAAAMGLPDAGRIPALFALTLVLEAAQAVAQPTWAALLPRIVGEERTPRALGSMQAALMLAQLAGPAAGGVLVGAGGMALSFWTAAVCHLLLAGGAAAIGTRRAPSDMVDGGTPRALDGLRVLNRDALLWAALVGALFVTLAAEAVNVLEIFLARQVLGATPEEYGMLAAAMGVGLVGGSLAAGRIGSERVRAAVFVLSVAGTGAGLVLMGTAPSIAWLFACSAFVGAWVGALNATFGALLVLRTPEAVRGQVSAMANGLTRAVSIGSLGLGGVLGSLFDPRLGFIVCGAATVAVAAGLGAAVARAGVRAAGAGGIAAGQ